MATFNILHEIAERISEWKRFSRILGIQEYFIRQTDLDENNCIEKAYKCLYEKSSTSPTELNWSFWREHLLKLGDEGKRVITDVELMRPQLLTGNENSSQFLQSIDHQLLKYGEGIFGHNDQGIDSFAILGIEQTDYVKICIGTGEYKIYDYKNYKEWEKIKEDYCYRYNLTNKNYCYNFSNFAKDKQCKTLRTLSEWIKNNDDKSFVVKGYDICGHFNMFSKTSLDIEYQNNDSYLLMYCQKENMILHIDAAPQNLQTSWRNNLSRIKILRSLHPWMNNNSITHIAVILLNENFQLSEQKSISCAACTNLGLITNSENFKNERLFQSWLTKALNHLKKMRQELTKDIDTVKLSQKFLSSIITYMALADCKLPTFTNNPVDQIDDTKKLIMFTSEQIDIFYSERKHMIIKGSFGSGKSIVAQHRFKKIVENESNEAISYYICHDQESEFVKDMKKFADTLNNESIRVCSSFDLVGDDYKLSSILSHLLRVNKGKTTNVVFEEFNGEVIDEEEIQRVAYLLEIGFSNSHIILVAQSVECQRFNKGVPFGPKLFLKYQYQRLCTQTDFQIFTLSYTMRSSNRINDLVSIAIPILETARIQSHIPKFSRTSNTNCRKPNNNHIISMSHLSSIVDSNNINKDTSSIVESNNINKDPLENYVTFQIGEARKLINRCNDYFNEYNDYFNEYNDFVDKCNDFVNEISNEITICEEEEESETEISNKYEKTLHQKVINKDETLKKITNTNSTYCNTYDTVQSEFKFIGERNKGHNIDGPVSELYYAFSTENKSFLHQLYRLTLILKKVLIDGINVVILYFNMECYHYLSTALKVMGKKYTTFQEDLKDGHTIFLAKYTAVRGCEFPNVILAYPLNEKHLKQHIVEGLNRCMINLKVIVFNHAVNSSFRYTSYQNSEDDNVLLDILNKWQNKKLVITFKLIQRSKFKGYFSNERFYLKGNSESQERLCDNANYLVFKKDHKHLENSYKEVVEDYINDPNILHKMGIESQLNELNKACFEALCGACETAEYENNISLLQDTFHSELNSTYNGDTLLHHCIHKEYFEPSSSSRSNHIIIMLIVKTDINVNAQDPSGRTALHLAIDYNNKRIVTVLKYSTAIDATILDNTGSTAYEYAAAPVRRNTLKKARFEVLCRACQEAANRNDISILINTLYSRLNYTYNGDTVLHYFIHNANGVNNLQIISVITMLIFQTSIDVNIQDANGKTALHWAALYNNAPVVNALLKVYIDDVDIYDDFCQTALHYAVENNLLEIVKIFLKAKIDIEMKNHLYETAYDISVRKKYSAISRLIRTTMNDDQLDRALIYC